MYGYDGEIEDQLQTDRTKFHTSDPAEHSRERGDCATTGGCFIRLFDMSGRIIHQQNLSMMDNDGNGSVTIDMSRYDNGIYFCALYSNIRLLQTEKLILMK
jgi:hypothetical protein